MSRATEFLEAFPKGFVVAGSMLGDRLGEASQPLPVRYYDNVRALV